MENIDYCKVDEAWFMLYNKDNMMVAHSADPMETSRPGS